MEKLNNKNKNINGKNKKPFNKNKNRNVFKQQFMPKRNGPRKEPLNQRADKLLVKAANTACSLERAIMEPGASDWVDIPSFPHPYGIFHDKFSFNLNTNALGALGVVALPAFVFPTVGYPTATNIGYWNGTAYNGISSVPTNNTSNIFYPAPSTNMMIRTDVASQNFEEISCIAYKMTITSPVPFTANQGVIYGGVRSLAYPLIADPLPWAGTQSTTASIFDTMNYSAAIQGLQPAYNSSVLLAGANSLQINYKPHETKMLEDLLYYKYNSVPAPGTAKGTEDLNDNVIVVAITGCSNAQTLLFKVEAVYAYTSSNKSITTQTMKRSQDRRLPQTVMFDLDSSDYKYVGGAASLGSAQQPQQKSNIVLDSTTGLWRPKLRGPLREVEDDISSTNSIYPPYNPLHVPGHNYLGPGTDVAANLLAQAKPIDYDDYLALNHDVEYVLANTWDDINKADDKMIGAITNQIGHLDPFTMTHDTIIAPALKAKRIYNKMAELFGASINPTVLDIEKFNRIVDGFIKP